MNNGASAVREAELALYNAPFDAAGWPGAIDRVRAAVGACTGNLVGMGGSGALPLTFWVGQHADEAERLSSDPELWGSCNYRVCTTRAPLSIQHDRHYAAYRAVADTERYDDVMSDLDMLGGCQSAVMIGNDGFVGLALAWGRRRGGVDDEVLDRFARLRTVLHRAVRMQLAIDNEAAEMMLGNVAAMQSATILLDRHGNLAAMTPLAETLFEEGGPMILESLAPRLRQRSEDDGLRTAMKRLLAHDGNGAHVHQARVGRRAGHPDGCWQLYLVRLPARDHGLGFDAQLALTIKPASSTQAR